jgi:hypothetical protein
VLQNCWHVLEGESAACSETFVTYSEDGNEDNVKVEGAIDIKEEAFSETEKFPLIKDELKVRCMLSYEYAVFVFACRH